MTAVRENGLIRTTASAESIFDGRTIPAGMKGTVLEDQVRRELPCRVRLRTANRGQRRRLRTGHPSRDQYEVIES